MTSLSAEQDSALTAYLEPLRRSVGAREILVVDVAGHLLSQCGEAETYDPGVIGVLLANGMAAAVEMAHVLDRGEGLSIFLHEGAKFDLYAATVTGSVVIALLFDRGQGNPRVGTVYVHIKRAIEDLSKLLIGEPMQATEAPNASAAPTYPKPGSLSPDTLVRKRPKPAPDREEPDRLQALPVMSYQEAAKLGLIRPKPDEP